MIGRKLGGRYQIVERLGAGGMGVVYRAEDTWLGRTVAIKVLRPELAADADFLRRFRREAKAAASLSHPNVVSLFDVGQDGDLHYLVMEYVPGPTLEERLDQGPLPPAEAVRVTSLVATALEHAHSHDVVHRDVKPQNILLAPRGQVKVADFGIARAGVASTVTHPGAIVGSVHYLAPEQVQGAPGDQQADVYSLGVVLYRMLTGRLPFEGDNPISVALKHVREEPQPLRRLAPRTPPGLERVVMRALCKDPGGRYASAADFLAALQGIDAQPGAAAVRGGEAVVGERSRNPVRHGRVTRRPRLVAWVLFAILLVGALAYGGHAFLRWWYVPTLTTPNVLRMDLSSAQEQLRARGLQYEVVGQQYSSEVEVSCVIGQDPDPGEPVKKGGMVKLWISLGPEFVKGGVPAVEGKSAREAEEILRSGGLEVRTTYRYDNEKPKDTVISQRPRAGDPAVRGAVVDLEVSSGPEPKPVSVPSVYGLTVDQAAARLKEAGLALGTVDEVPNALPRGMVCGQEPAAGQTVAQDTVVNIKRSKSTALPVHRSLILVSVPGKAEETRLVQVEVSDELGTAVVYSAPRAGGSDFPVVVTWAGNQGSVRILCDGQVVSQVALK
ncbi:MAG: PASTA domain-containing protein [Bacillota bacterium]|nr:PASTA domain-containing protein [Bacillota bacterium]